jgi:two-component system copper resistance phosphate regulon response regulator CusR
LALCKEFREINNKVPIIMLTALGELKDKMDAFNLGADDYIVNRLSLMNCLPASKCF